MPFQHLDIPLTLCPQVAATIGLEEAILLPQLQQIAQFSEQQSVQISSQKLLAKLPFWQAGDIQRISKSLADKGLITIHSAPFSQVDIFSFALNNEDTQQAPTPINQPVAAKGANRISPLFKPDKTCLAQLQQQGISAAFAQQQLPEFVAYWQERGEVNHAWNAKFLKHVLRNWQHRKAELPFAISNETQSMDKQWHPSQDALDILHNIGIEKNFIQACVPEFILYWQERGNSTNTWNTKFIQHVKRQWAKYTSTLKYDTEPKRISENWQPEPEVYDIIEMANIDKSFAEQQIHEFVLYWKESNQLHSAWSSKFLQHVKYRWAQQHQLQGQQHAGQQNSTGQSTATDFISKHTDVSWAENI